MHSAVGYLAYKAEHLDYATALRHGWPIATGAEAVLTLRALIDNGDLEDYWAFFSTPPRNSPAPPHPATRTGMT